jgi:putative ABC transport system substrate-binding protein
VDRRAFLGALGLLVAPRAAEAQQRLPHHVAFLTLNPRSGTAATTIDGLRQGFKELGYRDGQNLVLEHRFADGNRDLLPALAVELLRLQPAVIATFGTPATVATKSAAPTLPIVFIGAGDPVGSGFAESLARPGGRLTGFSFVGPELAARTWSSSRRPSREPQTSLSWQRANRTSHLCELCGVRWSTEPASST